MSTSRSTPRLRLTAGLLAAVVVLVALSQRRHASGPVGEVLQLAGLACIVVAALGRVWTSVFIAGYKDEALVTTGPYSALRHPLYALSTLAMAGVGLATGSLAITLGLLVVFGVVHGAAARAEDQRLAALHGAAFERYRTQVRSFLPRWSAVGLPDTVAVRPRVLWKAFLDAGSVLGVYLLVRIADSLQSHGVTPTWITLP